MLCRIIKGTDHAPWLSRTVLTTGLALLAPFAMHAPDSQRLLESYTPITYAEIENRPQRVVNVATYPESLGLQPA